MNGRIYNMEQLKKYFEKMKYAEEEFNRFLISAKFKILISFVFLGTSIVFFSDKMGNSIIENGVISTIFLSLFVFIMGSLLGILLLMLAGVCIMFLLGGIAIADLIGVLDNSEDVFDKGEWIGLLDSSKRRFQEDAINYTFMSLFDKIDNKFKIYLYTTLLLLGYGLSLYFSGDWFESIFYSIGSSGIVAGCILYFKVPIYYKLIKRYLKSKKLFFKVKDKICNIMSLDVNKNFKYTKIEFKDEVDLFERLYMYKEDVDDYKKSLVETKMSDHMKEKEMIEKQEKKLRKEKAIEEFLQKNYT